MSKQISIVKTAKRLISFKTVSADKEENYRCLQYIADDLKKSRFNIEFFESNGFYSLIVAKKIKKNYQFGCIGHIDVVPAENHDAFSPQEKNGKLYGRGAMDMKGQIAAMIQVLKDLPATKKDIALILTTDEEIGGFNGINYLFDQKGISCKCGINPDDGFFNKITLKQKGVLHVKITSTGKTAHGSRPWLGENAIDQIIKYYEFILKEFPFINSKDNWKPTINAGKINGGNGINNVAAKAEMYIDFRYPSTNDREWIIHILDQTRQNHNSISYKILVEGLPFELNKNNRYIKKLQKIGLQHGIQFGYHYAHGASDSRFLIEKNIPVIMFRPKSSEAHIENEWVDIKSLYQFYELLLAFLLQ